MFCYLKWWVDSVYSETPKCKDREKSFQMGDLTLALTKKAIHQDALGKKWEGGVGDGL